MQFEYVAIVAQKTVRAGAGLLLSTYNAAGSSYVICRGEIALCCALPFFYDEWLSEEHRGRIFLEKFKLKMGDSKQVAEDVEKKIIAEY